jgi:sigma-B regulation protein RsbU (phosphoserine phosphatase)
MSFRSSLRSPWFLSVAVAILLAGQSLASPLVQAQAFDAVNQRQPVDLGMTWLVHAGDDPAYARPDFDDSHWTRFNPSTSLQAVFPDSHPQIIWCRLHVKVRPNETGLALEAWEFANAFEIYANGERIMQVGRVAPFAPYTATAHVLKRIPDMAIATGSLVIAVRVHIPLTGGISHLRLGRYEALASEGWLAIIGWNALYWFYVLSGLGLGIVALALFAAQPRQREYLWIFLVFFCTALWLPFSLYGLRRSLPLAWTEFAYLPIRIAEDVFLVLMYFTLLRIPFGRWIQALLVLVAVADLAASVERAHGAVGLTVAILGSSPEGILFGAVITVLLVVQMRRGNREAGILLIPAAFTTFEIWFGTVINLFSGPAARRLVVAVYAPNVGPFRLHTAGLGDCLFLLSLGVIITLRSSRTARQQAVLEGELAAAREVQQVILPEQVEAVPGFKVESVYQPAEKVGGDFFQVLSTRDGGLLAVVGDVAGKGLPSAMLVSMLVGTIRGVAEYTSDPAELLANLNERLVGRAGGFSTAVAALIGSEGSVMLAGAGHLPPYLDGEEVELPSALPLGVRSGTRYEAVRFRVEPGSRLTFYSDGIVEAQRQDGEMFGFERARQFSTRTPNEIVSAARAFGQQDDMTVVSIQRAPALVSEAKIALQSSPAPAV